MKQFENVFKKQIINVVYNFGCEKKKIKICVWCDSLGGNIFCNLIQKKRIYPQEKWGNEK